MKHTIIFVFIFIVTARQLHAQSNTMAGEYSLASVMETAPGMVLNKDSTFHFYFSYGALDREGSGKWSTHGNDIILDQQTLPG